MTAINQPTTPAGGDLTEVLAAVELEHTPAATGTAYNGTPMVRCSCDQAWRHVTVHAGHVADAHHAAIRDRVAAPLNLSDITWRIE